MALRANSRWMLRPEENYDSPPDDFKKYSVLFFVEGITDETAETKLNDAISRYVFVGNNFISTGNEDSPFDAEVIQGNDAARELMTDYDAAINAGRTMAFNFEIEDPFGGRDDVDWVGSQIFHTFGEGWAGTPDPRWPRGYQYTYLSKREILERIIGLAHLGWGIRGSRPFSAS